MKVNIEVKLSFQSLVCAIEALDNYHLSLKGLDAQRIVSRDHKQLKEKLRGGLISSEKPLKDYRFTFSNREIAYLRKIVFQYFIASLKEGIIERNDSCHKLFIKLNLIIGIEGDEIQEITNLLVNKQRLK